MSQEFKSMDDKRCYTCIQWEGLRSWDKDTRLIKVDEKVSENCLLQHKKVRGDSVCDHFFPVH